jgi:hypothetical protein
MIERMLESKLKKQKAAKEEWYYSAIHRQSGRVEQGTGNIHRTISSQVEGLAGVKNGLQEVIDLQSKMLDLVQAVSKRSVDHMTLMRGLEHDQMVLEISRGSSEKWDQMNAVGEEMERQSKLARELMEKTHSIMVTMLTSALRTSMQQQESMMKTLQENHIDSQDIIMKATQDRITRDIRQQQDSIIQNMRNSQEEQLESGMKSLKESREEQQESMLIQVDMFRESIRRDEESTMQTFQKKQMDHQDIMMKAQDLRYQAMEEEIVKEIKTQHDEY